VNRADLAGLAGIVAGIVLLGLADLGAYFLTGLPILAVW
jgi:hypothetical protein